MFFGKPFGFFSEMIAAILSAGVAGLAAGTGSPLGAFLAAFAAGMFGVAAACNYQQQRS